MTTPLPSAKEPLLAGVEILKYLLEPHDFVFEFRSEERGSGGDFARGEFVRSDRRLEFHYRRNLGLVTYHALSKKATHEAYMRELGVWGRNRYPGFSSDYLQAFRDLAHDIAFCADFLKGKAKVLLSAAHNESIANVDRSEHLMAGYVGDTRNVDKMHKLFREKRYAEVVAIFDELQFPHQLPDAQLLIVKLARARIDSARRAH